MTSVFLCKRCKLLSAAWVFVLAPTYWPPSVPTRIIFLRQALSTILFAYSIVLFLALAVIAHAHSPARSDVVSAGDGTRSPTVLFKSSRLYLYEHVRTKQEEARGWWFKKIYIYICTCIHARPRIPHTGHPKRRLVPFERVVSGAHTKIPSVYDKLHFICSSSATPCAKKKEKPQNRNSWSDWLRSSRRILLVGSLCEGNARLSTEEADDFIYFYFRELRILPLFNLHSINTLSSQSCRRLVFIHQHALSWMKRDPTVMMEKSECFKWNYLHVSLPSETIAFLLIKCPAFIGSLLFFSFSLFFIYLFFFRKYPSFPPNKLSCLKESSCDSFRSSGTPLLCLTRRMQTLVDLLKSHNWIS